MDNFPRDPRKIKIRIGSYERALRREQKQYGFINDGAGKRYLLGPLYLLMGDTEGALKSFTWFAQTFPDDSGEPLHRFCWTLARYRAGEEAPAVATLRQTMLSNLYLIPRLLGIEQEVIDMWHPSNWAHKAYIDAFPEDVFALWEPAALRWVHTAYHSDSLSRVRHRYIAIYTRLKNEPPGRTRSRLVNESLRLKYPERH